MFSREYPLVHAVLAAIQAVVSVVCLLQAATWAGGTTESRLAGISWVSVSAGQVATAWAVTGILGMVGAFARYRPLQTAGVLALGVGPLLIAMAFMGAWLQGSSPNGWVTAASYASWSAVAVAPYAALLLALKRTPAPITGTLPVMDHPDRTRQEGRTP